MLNIYKYNNLINFSADVFLCEKHQSSNGLNCWNLRLLVNGQLIDAYHWHSVRGRKIHYREKDSVLVVGNWATKHRQHFQIIRSEIIPYIPANDELFIKNTMCTSDSTFTNTIKVPKGND